MNHVDSLRVVMIAGFVLLTSVGLTYRLRSHTGEDLDRRQEGWLILIGLRLTSLLLFAGLVAWIVDPRWMRWSELPLPAPARWAGAAIAAASLLLKFWTFHSLGRNLTDTVVTRQQHSLVTHGAYRWMRHPFYTSFLFDVIGVSLMTANVFILVSGIVVFLFLLVRTRTEERKLIERFGDDYRRYQDRVGRFFPSPLRTAQRPETSDGSPHA